MEPREPVEKPAQEQNEAIESVPVVLLPSTREEVEASGKFPILREDLRLFIAQYKDLKVDGVADKEGYKAMDTARKTIKAKRSLIKSTGEMMRAGANKYAKAVIELQKSLTDELEPTEIEFEEVLDKIDQERERLREEEQRKEDERIQDMLNLLRNVGSDMDIYELKAITPERFEIVLAEATQAFEKKQAEDEERRQKEEAEEKERIRLEEIERMAREKELKEERGRQDKERIRLADEKEKFEKEQDLHREKERQLQEEKERIETEKAAIAKAKLEMRVKRFTEIGFTWTGFSAIYEPVKERSVKVRADQVQNSTDIEFEGILLNAIDLKKDTDLRIEDERLHEETRKKNEAVDKERIRLEEEQKQKEVDRQKAQVEAREKLMQGEDADRFLYLSAELDALLNDGVFSAMQSKIGQEAGEKIITHLAYARQIARDNSGKPTA